MNIILVSSFNFLPYFFIEFSIFFRIFCSRFYLQTILSLSLCYCNITHKSGPSLGVVACQSTIREFLLDGNKLEAAGVEEMLKGVAIAEEDEHYRRIEEEKMKALMMAEGALSGGWRDAVEFFVEFSTLASVDLPNTNYDL